MNFKKRLHLFGFKRLGWRGVLGSLISLAISMCVLLTGVAINTIGIPKERWYTNPPGSGGFRVTKKVKKKLTVETPQMILNNIDWMNYWGVAWNLVGSGDPSWEAAVALAAASTYSALTYLPNTFNWEPGGWQSLGDTDEGLTAFNTDTNGSFIESVSVQNSKIQDIFNELQVGKHEFAQQAIGFTGLINITTPLLTTSFSPTPESGRSGNSNAVFVYPPPAPPGNKAISVVIEDVPSLNFSSVTLPRSTIGGGDPHLMPIQLAPSSSDYLIAHALATQLLSTVDATNGLFPSPGISQHLVLMARRLSYLNSTKFASGDDAASLAPTVASVAQYLLTVGNWNMSASADPNAVATSYPVSWQIYGAGPRLAWEWVTVVVLAVILAALMFGAVLTAWWRIRPGAWLDLGGMLVAANSAERFESIRGSVIGEPSEEAKKANFCVLDLGSGEVELQDDRNHGARLERKKRYQNLEPEAKYRRLLDKLNE
ncbi:MAG: hypothetical protein M1822_004224 [Bathelium mastoideum]|nr:MAG: hypothetical protein M1822_004224 [Bathelium mastoideum]